MIKRNIKIMTTRGIQVKKICGILDIEYEIDLSNHLLNIYFIIDNNKNFKVGYGGDNFAECTYPEVDADLFIRTNGTCEEISQEGLCKIKAASEGKPIEYLQEKIINLHKQINKDRATIKNQKEELNKLNLKLQKCISLEEHNKIVESMKSKNKELEQIARQLSDDNVAYLENISIKNNKDKEIEKLKAIIEYLEEKLK